MRGGVGCRRRGETELMMRTAEEKIIGYRLSAIGYSLL
jgi:hypothetical protein